MRRSQSDGGFWNDCPCVLALTCIHDIVLVIDGQNLRPIESHLNQCLVLLRKPESVNFLVLSHEVGPLDPEREFFRGMALNPYNGVFLYVDPELTFKQVFVFPLGHCLGDEATIWTNLLFTQQIQGIVVSRNRAVMMFFSGCRLDLTFYQRIQRQAPDQARPSFGIDCECLLVWREKLHPSDFLSVHLSFEINDLISPQDAIVVQGRPALLVMRGKFGKHSAFCDSWPQRLDGRLQVR